MTSSDPKPSIPTSIIEIDKKTIILIADDSDIAAKFLRKILIDIGFRTINITEDGEQTLHAFNLLHPHLVFLDIDMPRIDGLQVLRKIREYGAHALSEEIRQSFIVMVSAKSTINNIKEAVASGDNGFIVKPYNSQKILEIVEKFQKTKGDIPPSLKISDKIIASR